MNIEDVIGNAVAKKDGVWVTYEADDDDPKAEFLICYLDSPKPRNWYAKELGKARGGRRNIPIETVNELTIQLLVKFGVKDWRNVKANGEAYPFTEDNCDTFLRNSPTISDWIADAGRNIENFRGSSTDAEASTATAAIKSEPPLAVGVR
jgi:hypothetical protein